MNANKFLILVLVVSASTIALGKTCQSLGRTDAVRRRSSANSCGDVKSEAKCSSSYESHTNHSCVWK